MRDRTVKPEEGMTRAERAAYRAERTAKRSADAKAWRAANRDVIAAYEADRRARERALLGRSTDE